MKKITDHLLKLFFKDSASTNTSLIVGKTMKIFILQLTAVLLVFAGNVLIARWFGDETYGLYSHLFNWFSLLTVLAMSGMDDYHVAVIPPLKEKQSSGTMRKVFWWSVKITVSAAVLISLLFIGLPAAFSIKGLTEYADEFKTGIYLVLLLTVMGNLMAWLRGMDQVIPGQIGDKLIRPAVFLLIIIFIGISGLMDKNIYSLLTASALSILVVILVLAIVVYRFIPGKNADRTAAEKHDSSLKKNVYFLSISILYLLTARLDILTIGSLSGIKDVGYYNVALKIADLVMYPVVIVNLILPPMLSRYHYLNDKKEIFRLIRNGALVMFGGCLLLLSGILITGQWLIGLYGDNFQQAFVPLLILCISHLLTAFTGPVNAYFLVSGREKPATLCMLMNVLVTALLCFLLIPRMGIIGAALASLAGSLVFNFLIILLFLGREKVIITPFRIFRFS